MRAHTQLSLLISLLSPVFDTECVWITNVGRERMGGRKKEGIGRKKWKEEGSTQGRKGEKNKTD